MYVLSVYRFMTWFNFEIPRESELHFQMQARCYFQPMTKRFLHIVFCLINLTRSQQMALPTVDHLRQGLNFIRLMLSLRGRDIYSRTFHKQVIKFYCTTVQQTDIQYQNPYHFRRSIQMSEDLKRACFRQFLKRKLKT